MLRVLPVVAAWLFCRPPSSQLIAHPWLQPSRDADRALVGSLCMTANSSVSKRPPSPSDSVVSYSPTTTVRRNRFLISKDPADDLCPKSMKKMEAFGADAEEIARQVMFI